MRRQPNRFVIAGGASGWLWLASCGAWQDDPCRGVQCSGHGRCVVESGEAACSCDPGYQAQAMECVPEPDECSGIACSEHGECVVRDGAAVCVCDPGYQPRGLQCVPAVTPCNQSPCGDLR